MRPVRWADYCDLTPGRKSIFSTIDRLRVHRWSCVRSLVLKRSQYVPWTTRISFKSSLSKWCSIRRICMGFVEPSFSTASFRPWIHWKGMTMPVPSVNSRLSWICPYSLGLFHNIWPVDSFLASVERAHRREEGARHRGHWLFFEGSVSQYARFICTMNLQYISEVLRKCWALSLALDKAMHMGTGYDNTRTRLI